MADNPVGCAKPTGTVIGDTPSEDVKPAQDQGGSEMVTARVGGPAPDFEAPAYFRGEFKNIKLSDYSGKWVLLCFYPGDFTFV